MRFILIISFIIFCSFGHAFASDNDEKEPDKQYQRYEDIKRKHNQDYKKGLYKDEKKDYVNNWISEDINYQKRVIKLKSDYKAWAKERQDSGKEVVFNEYEPLKSLTVTERGILLEYHNMLFKNKDKEKGKTNKAVESPAAKKVMPKKSVEQKVAPNKDNEYLELIKDLEGKDGFSDSEPEAEKPESFAEDDSGFYIYVIIGFALMLVVAECIYLIVKRIK